MTTRTLKIKIKSLAAEARFIRHEERKLTPPRDELGKRHWHEQNLIDYTSLHTHRTYNVRKASREALLAYGFLRGRNYRQMESKCYSQPDWHEIASTIKRFDFNWSTGKKNNTPLDIELLTWRDAQV